MWEGELKKLNAGGKKWKDAIRKVLWRAGDWMNEQD